jgi:SAM-dependent methyltransferase
MPGGNLGSPLGRPAWLEERRAAVEATYDAEAPTYDREDIPITPTHAHFVSQLLDTTAPAGTVLDAPCGTGKYFDMVRSAGRQVVGIDQSAGMLARARATGLAARLHQVGLQELTWIAQFDGVMCIDAMENVFPEDWPGVLANLHRALRAGSHLYLTVEELDDGGELDAALANGTAAGLPVVRGEVIEGDVAGYHYYPERSQVDRWLDRERLVIVEEGKNYEDGWGYRHLLVRSRDA